MTNPTPPGGQSFSATTPGSRSSSSSRSVSSRLHQQHPARERPRGGARKNPSNAQEGLSLQTLVAQASAVIGILVAFIYISGALTLIFKLWYLQVPWTSVLGQLPHDFIITTAFTQVIAPTLAVAAILTFVHARYLTWNWPKKRRSKRRQFFVSTTLNLSRYILLNIVLIAPALLILWLTKRYGNGTVLRDTNSILWLCEGLAVLPLLSYFIVTRIEGLRLRGASKYLAMLAVYTIALMPVAAAVSAATLLPVVTLCGPKFPAQQVSQHSQKHFIRGNLIGNNSQDIYIAQWHLTSNGSITPLNQITVIPESMVRLEVLGSDDDCSDLGN